MVGWKFSHSPIITIENKGLKILVAKILVRGQKFSHFRPTSFLPIRSTTSSSLIAVIQNLLRYLYHTFVASIHFINLFHLSLMSLRPLFRLGAFFFSWFNKSTTPLIISTWHEIGYLKYDVAQNLMKICKGRLDIIFRLDNFY